MGLVVGITRAGVPATDMLVTSESGGRSISVQVKTGGIHSHIIRKRKPENNAWCWRTGARAKNLSGESHWFAFVYVGDWPSGGDMPEVFFVPSKVVAKKARDPEIVEGWFWISEAEAEQYRGAEGCKRLTSSLRTLGV